MTVYRPWRLLPAAGYTPTKAMQLRQMWSCEGFMLLSSQDECPCSATVPQERQTLKMLFILAWAGQLPVPPLHTDVLWVHSFVCRPGFLQYDPKKTALAVTEKQQDPAFFILLLRQVDLRIWYDVTSCARICERTSVIHFFCADKINYFARSPSQIKNLISINLQNILVAQQAEPYIMHWLI